MDGDILRGQHGNIECKRRMIMSDNSLNDVGFGTANLGDAAENSTYFAAGGGGYRLIDTARVYGSEQAVGNALHRIYKETDLRREDFIVQTKLSPEEGGYHEALADFDRSLNDLQMDYVDVYFIHWPVSRGNEHDYHERNIASWQAFEELQRKGRVRMLGVCNFLERHLLDIIENCDVMPQIHQLELHPGFQQIGLVEFSRKHGMQIEAWSPMGRGLLNKPEYIQMADSYGKNIGQLALRWCVQKGFLPLSRSSNKEHIEGNREIFDFSISDEDMEKLDQLNTNTEHMDIWSYKRQQMY